MILRLKKEAAGGEMNAMYGVVEENFGDQGEEWSIINAN
jgi:hypothetical protein